MSRVKQCVDNELLGRIGLRERPCLKSVAAYGLDFAGTDSVRFATRCLSCCVATGCTGFILRLVLPAACCRALLSLCASWCFLFSMSCRCSSLSAASLLCASWRRAEKPRHARDSSDCARRRRFSNDCQKTTQSIRVLAHHTTPFWHNATRSVTVKVPSFHGLVGAILGLLQATVACGRLCVTGKE